MADPRVRITHDEVATLPEGLQRKSNGYYYLRRRVPKDLVPALGYAEYSHALGTNDPKVARRMLPQLLADLLEEFDAVRSGAAPSSLPLLSKKYSALSGRGRGTLPQVQSAPTAATIATNTISDAEFEHILEMQEESKYQTEIDLRQQYEWEALEERAVEISRREAIDLTDAEKAIRMLYLERAEYRQLYESGTALKAQVPQPAMTVLPTVATTGSSDAAQTATQETLLDTLVDRWAAERKPDAKTVDAHRAVARWFVERLGPLPVEAIKKRHVLSFKDRLLEEGQKLPNIKVKLTRLRTLLNYAVDNDLMDNNPAAMVRVVVPDGDRVDRKSFDLQSLRALFASPIYTSDLRPLQGRGEAAYWLPILGLYTGARLEELGQLRPGDVRLESYPDGDDIEQSAWVIRVTEDAEDGLKLKNLGSRRLIPVHPVLEELGFVKFAQDASGNQRLFPELRPNKYGRLTAKWGEWFSAYKRAEAGITDDGMVFHSFRHTFKDHGRGRMAEGVQRRIMGHSGVGTADEYGDGHFLWQLVEGMRQYKVSGLAPPPPPPKFR